MYNQRNTLNMANKKADLKKNSLLIGAGVLFALSAVVGLMWGQLLIPLGCAAVVGGILLLSMKLSFDNGGMTAAANAMFVVAIIVGGVLLFKGLTAGIGRQDDLSYTKSLDITADELLATKGSEGTQYAVVRDGLISRHLLPTEYSAERVEDIGEVLIVNTVHSKTGSYTNGGTAYRTNVVITLKSLKTGETIDSTTLYGSDPPSHVRISPLDPNKDRYGSAPSEGSIRNAIATMISREKAEEARQSRVTLLSDDELLDLMHGVITASVGDDGWSSFFGVEDKLKEANPDFSIKDYGYKDLKDYFKSDAHYEVNLRSITDPDYWVRADYVRWAG
ncbi:MAG: OST-HTH/LOTUS domain-containing protein [Lachnospiraceae bacterium]|nr:OST-HTH/LOTUS domain-containing protein [Lachnospiraceae bacterium]